MLAPLASTGDLGKFKEVEKMAEIDFVLLHFTLTNIQHTGEEDLNTHLSSMHSYGT